MPPKMKKVIFDKDNAARVNKIRNLLVDTVQRELKKGDITALELLAVLAHTVGVCAAMQDQQEITPAIAMDVVSKNIEIGNKQVIDLLTDTGEITH